MTFPIRSIAAPIATALAIVASPASAIDVTLYNLNTTAVAAFGEPSYGSVSLSQDGTAVDFLIELREDLNLVFDNDGGSTAAFSFNATGVAVGDISGVMDKAGKTFAVAQPGIDAPFGVFTFGIVCVSNCAHSVFGDVLAFKVADATLADFRIESTGGNPNAQFAADVFMTGSGVRGAVSAILVATPVPEPATYALMLAGLGAAGFIARRRKAAVVSQPNRAP